MQRKRRQLAEGYLTGLQLAEKLGIGRTTLGRWMRTGKLKPTKSVGGMRLFDRAAVTEISKVSPEPLAVFLSPDRDVALDRGEPHRL